MNDVKSNILLEQFMAFGTSFKISKLLMKQYCIWIRESFYLSVYLVELNHSTVVHFVGLILVLRMDAHSITYLGKPV